MDTSTASHLGQTEGEPIARVTIQFYGSSYPDRAVGGYRIIHEALPQLARAASDASWSRRAINALMDEMEDLTTPDAL